MCARRYALGKSKGATVRRVLLPSIRPGITTGTALGMGRIIGDTPSWSSSRAGPCSSRRPEASRTSGRSRDGLDPGYVLFETSPAGEGNAPAKAYAAAAVLLVIVLLLNYIAARIARGGREVQQRSR